MNIGQAEQTTGLSRKTIRYYESIGLIRAPKRSENGYRNYNDDDLAQMQFIAHARQTGFTIDECKTLVELYRDSSRHSKHVKSFVLEKIEHVEQQITQLQNMRNTLRSLSEQCQGDDEANCAILNELSKPADQGLVESTSTKRRNTHEQ